MASSLTSDLVSRLREFSQDSTAHMLHRAEMERAAVEIEKLRQQRTEARLLLDEVQAKHASDPLPERIYDFLKRTKERP